MTRRGRLQGAGSIATDVSIVANIKWGFCLLAQKGGLPMPSNTMLAVLLTAALIASAVRVTPGEVSAPPATRGSAAAPIAWVDDLAPLSPSEWNDDRAAHLLERAG